MRFSIWSDMPSTLRAPRIVFVGHGTPSLSQGAPQILLETKPQFYSWTFTIPDDPGKRAWVQFGPLAEAPASLVNIFIDNIVLAVGDFQNAEVPDPSANGIEWGGRTVENLLREPSAESAWINPRPWADDLWSRVFGYSSHRWASFIFYTLRDWSGAGWYYETTSVTLFRTFWATFGWGHVDLLGGKPYRWLLVVTVVLILGGLGGLWQAIV